MVEDQSHEGLKSRMLAVIGCKQNLFFLLLAPVRFIRLHARIVSVLLGTVFLPVLPFKVLNTES